MTEKIVMLDDPEAAHAASEFDDDQRPHLDEGAEMLGRLIVYVCVVIVVIGSVAAMVWLR